MLIPSWANSTGGSPYSFSKAHLAPLLSEFHHSASRTFTTNQPWVTGVSPDPKSSSCASDTDAILAPRDGPPIWASVGESPDAVAWVIRRRRRWRLDTADARRADRPGSLRPWS